MGWGRGVEPFAHAILSYLRAAHCEEPSTHLGRRGQPLAALIPDLGATAEAASALAALTSVSARRCCRL